MTEPRIAAQIEGVTAHLAALERWAADLATMIDHASDLARWTTELARVREWVEGGSVLDQPRTIDRLTRILAEVRAAVEPMQVVERMAPEVALAVAALARLYSPPPGESGASEQTDRIIVHPGAETCSRCAGTGEVPIIEVLP